MNYNELLINWKSSILCLGVLFILCLPLRAQVDSTDASKQSSVKQVDTRLGTIEGRVVKEPDAETIMARRHDPRKATIKSAILPGWGQVYNKKYWKVPIIYGGLGVAGWYLRDNLQKIDLYKSAIIAEQDGDPNTSNDTGFTQDQLFTLVDQHKTWRDLSYIAIAAIYILNIVDASVDAHLFYFDVSPDISLKMDPYYSPDPMRGAGLVLTMKL